MSVDGQQFLQDVQRISQLFERAHEDAKSPQETKLAMAGLVLLGKHKCEGDNTLDMVAYARDNIAEREATIATLQSKIQKLNNSRLFYMHLASALFKELLTNEAEQID